jgi:radical SAM superfamily enzyme YgiQ (UPF0313 family)
VAGGPHTSFKWHELPDFIDAVVIGEAENNILDVVEGKNTERIVRGKIVRNLDLLPSQPWDLFIHKGYDWTAFDCETPVYTLNTSRGCPFRCSFCSVNAFFGRTYRCMSAEIVVDKIQFLQKHYGLRTAYFREDNFTFSKKRTVNFCELLLKKNMKIGWICETRADSLMDPEVVALMYRAGCKRLYIGVESGSPKMLELFNKGETVEMMETAIRSAHKNHIKVYASFVVGVPGETDIDIQLTHEFVDRVKPDYTGYNVYIGLPGSAMYNQIVDYDLLLYEDTLTGIRYLKGHNQRVMKYYNDKNLLCPVEEKD